jgi:uncharacterized protein
MNDDFQFLGPGEAATDPPAMTPGIEGEIECWRCGKIVSAQKPACPFCSAKLVRESFPVPTAQPPADLSAQPWTRLFIVFSVLLGISLVVGLVHRGAEYISPQHQQPPQQGEAVAEILILEALDTLIILFSWAWIGRCRSEPQPEPTRRLATWLLSAPALACILVLNILYHWYLRRWLSLVPIEVIFARDKTYLGWWILAICIQPAIVEEFFFRYLSFNVLRPLIGGQTTVWVTAAMFASAHIYAPFSLPVLFTLGVVLGYTRLGSGGILLPMILHFLHNAAVLVLNGQFFN